ncbi:uncharacterized protein CG43427 isoform X1 [Scaptodrosophila lebanonensis]|uniref:Uncharacterized protein CG43427 isoform X1 n=1 Tax=Drosophila lebanonensis TaxID=7225 RepID=A0A6J2TLR6_DROLE|nr:uncharacterized protein CG43427 isoform X1 [Scaptodrosophila lebanonensis]XP_030376450.1 uncharacterized protein CG43427 isoform X1 [Scaptodrosophila lebanonensis]
MECPEQDVMLDSNEDLMSTSGTSTNGAAGDTNGCGKKSTITSPDPTSYVTKARVTRPTPPPPSYNPMQFVQIKPCNLYQTAQQQLKKAEEVKKLKEVKKEEPEEWQNNLDNWKSSRRKRVEHIIDRVVETKKLELEEHDRMRRKSKTFTEMMEERAERGGSRARAKLASLAVYNEDEANDFSDLGIGTSSASGKSSLSEDYDNNSVMSDHAAELDKAIGANGGAASIEEQQNHINSNNKPTTSSTSKGANAAAMREYISSPGYDTSSSTAPASSPDPCEYTYEGAIQDYKQRVQRASNSVNKPPAANNNMKTTNSNGEHSEIAYPTRRGSKIEDRLSGFEVTSPSDTQEGVEKQKVDVPKVDISKRKEIFEQREQGEPKNSNGLPPKVVLRDRFNAPAVPLTNGNAVAMPEPAAKKEVKRLSGDLTSIRDRMQSLEQQRNAFNASKSVDVPVPPLKQRLSSLQNAVTKEEQQKKPPLVALIDARQLEIMRGEEERMRQQQKLSAPAPPPPALIVEEPPVPPASSGTNDDSGIQADNEDMLLQKEQEQQLNAAIAALALEERQLEEAANAVNQIEQEFAELTDLNPAPLTTAPINKPQLPPPPAQSQPAPQQSQQQQPQPQPRDMEFSVSSTNNFIQNEQIEPTINSPKEAVTVSGNVVVASAIGDVVSVSGNPSQSTSSPSSNANCNLRRKPSNEMVHARNLLKMFKETFQNDIELDEAAENEIAAPVITSPAPPSGATPAPISGTPASTGTVVTQIFDFTKPSKPTPPNSPTVGQHPHITRSSTTTTTTTTSPQGPNAAPPTQIPRAIAVGNPIGKPPMSPKALRYNPKAVSVAAPQSSPPSAAAQQFSINGRVEIFNSRQMEKPPTPTLPPKRTQHAALTQLSTAKEQINLQQPATALQAGSEALTVNEPLRTTEGNAEVVVCAPPVTIVNPDELPKPNTVKALSSCFVKAEAPPQPLPKPLPRSRIPQITPPQSPTPAKRQSVPTPTQDVTDNAVHVELRHWGSDQEPARQHSSIISSCSGDYAPVVGQTKAIVHSPPSNAIAVPPKPLTRSKPVTKAPNSDPLAPNDSMKPQVTRRSDMPALPSCAPNESSLFKLATSAPSSPVSPRALEAEVALCQQFLSSQAPTGLAISPEDSVYMRQQTIEELPCDKVDVHKEPLPCTGFQDVSMAEVRRCDGYEAAPKQVEPEIVPSEADIALCTGFLDSLATCATAKRPSCLPQRQRTVEEPLCESIDVHKMPAPATGFQDISEADVKRCDNLGAAAPSKNKTPSSPIMVARAAHSKALIDTCEQIIAEERLASSQMMNASLPDTPKTSTPLLARKSKIPIPKPCCISSSGTDSIQRVGYAPAEKEAPPTPKDDNLLIARTHVVETQIKVTTTTPPSSPKPAETQSPTPPTKEKKTKNIFDFLRRNFGHHEEPNATTTLNETIAPTVVLTSTRSGVDVVNPDEFVKVDNSKFYVPSEEPPPLPKTPAPVNIEIRKTITTDEIVEENATETELTQEINDMLDDEINKLEVGGGDRGVGMHGAGTK